MNYKNIMDIVNKKHSILRGLALVIGAFILAFVYTVFLLPNGIITGGVSGLGTIANYLFDINAATFIFIANIVLIIISFIFLGKEKTAKTIVGSMLYPLFINIITPLSEYVMPYLEFDNFIIPLVIFTILYGVACGVIYKSGYTTGGSDILMQIVNKYFNISLGKANLITSLILLAFGGFTFGIEKLIYSICVIYVSNLLIDRINIGISDSKMFLIYTDKEDEVKDFVINQMNAGITIIETRGGYSKSKNKMLMCVVPTKDYYLFRETVLMIDPESFFVISDCYEVAGGVKRSNLPFQ